MYFALTTVYAQTHPAEPAVNLGDTSFLDGIAGPGLLIEETVDGDHSHQVVDNTGTPVIPIEGSNAISASTHVAWLFPHTFLGGWYGVEFIQGVAHINAGHTDTGQVDAGQADNGAGTGVTGAGDLTISPFILQWEKQKFGSSGFLQQRVDLDLDLPTGEYNADAPLSISSHAFDVHPNYVITAVPMTHLETSLRFHYLWNATDASPGISSDAHSTQAGQAVHFNATVGYRVFGGLWVGLNGYYLRQLSNPRRNGIPLRNSLEQVGAIGPGGLWDLGHWVLYANAYHEVGVLNRPTGSKLVLRLQWAPGKKGRAGQ